MLSRNEQEGRFAGKKKGFRFRDFIITYWNNGPNRYDSEWNYRLRYWKNAVKQRDAKK